MISTASISTPALAKNERYEFPPVDLVQTDREAHLPVRGRVALSVELAASAGKAASVIVETSRGDYYGPYVEVGRLALAAGESARCRFVVEPARFTKFSVANGGAAQPPVAVAVTYHESERADG